MAGAVNIPIGVTVSGLIAGFRQGSQAVGDFTSQFKAQFNGLKGSTDAPAGALASLTRQFNIARREISDIIAVGGQPTAELANRFALLQGSLNAIKGAFATPVPTTAFQSLQNRLSETKAEMQDLLTKGEPIPPALAQRFRVLESQVASVNREFAQTPSRLEQIGKAGASIQALGLRLSALSAGIGFLGVTSFQSYAEINALLLGLQNITGSAEGARARFKELGEVAKLPGLGLQEAVQGDVRLQAIGFSAEKSKNILLQFGNALALTGGGKFELNSVLTQLTQMGSKAKVLSEDLKPILTASPAVAKAIKELFGTVDSEQISAKLQAAGQGPQQFIDNLVLKLSELERVGSGPKNAIENIGDALLRAKNNFGEAADKAFGLTGIIDRLGNFATSTAEAFGALSPGIQRGILVTAGLVAAAGPLLLTFGSIAAIAPSVAAGITLITGALGVSLGPIVLVGAAVAGVAILIASNWDLVKKTLTDSGIWQSVTGLVSSAMDSIRTVFTGITDAISVVWNAFGSTLVTYGRSVFNLLGGVFNAGLGFISGTFQLFAGILTGNWGKALGGLVTAGKAILGGLLSIFQSAFGAIGATIAGLLRLGGAGNLADTVLGATKEGVDSIGAYITKLRDAETQAKKTAAAVGGVVKPATATAKPFDYSGIDLGGSALKQAKDRLKELKDLIGSGILKGQDVSAYREEYARLSEQVKQATISTQKQKTALEQAQQTLGDLGAKIQNFAFDGIKPPVSLLKAYDDLKAKIESAQKATEQLRPVDLGDKLKIAKNPLATDKKVGDIASNVLGNLNGPALPGLAQFLDRMKVQTALAARDMGDAFDSLNTELKTRFSRSFSGNGVGLGELSQILQNAQIDVENKVTAFKNYLGIAKDQLAGAGVDLLVGFGSAIGGGENPLKSVLKTITNFIGDFAIKLGSAILLMGKLETVAAAIPGLAPLFALTGPAKIAVGAGLIIGGAAIKAIPGFAKGGTFYGENIIRVGEYPGAKYNPELVGKASEFQKYLGSARGGSQVFIPDIMLEGSMIRIALNRADEDNYHTR